jgi:hypothetical protein
MSHRLLLPPLLLLWLPWLRLLHLLQRKSLAQVKGSKLPVQVQALLALVQGLVVLDAPC